MDAFRNVLVAASPGRLDAPDAAGVLAVAGPATDQPRVTVMDVVEPIPPRRRLVEVGGRPVDLQERILADRCARLRRAVADLPGGAGAEVHVTAGTPVVEVVRRVLTAEHDLVVVGTPPPDGRGLDPEILQLLRKCPVPVWVVRPGPPGRRAVLALVDPQPDGDGQPELDDTVMELATALVRRHGGQLHVAHAWRLHGESELRSSPFVRLPAAEVDVMVDAAAQEHRARVEELVHRHGADELGSEIHLRKGLPGAVLPALAEQLAVDLVVMGTVGRTGLSGLVMGDTAETILRSIHGSVLAVKPEGFTSPVRAGPTAATTSC